MLPSTCSYTARICAEPAICPVLNPRLGIQVSEPIFIGESSLGTWHCLITMLLTMGLRVFLSHAHDHSSDMSTRAIRQCSAKGYVALVRSHRYEKDPKNALC